MVEAVIEVEVVYAAVDRQVLLVVDVPEGASVREALREASAVDAQFPELDLSNCLVGIFGKVVADPEVCARFRQEIASRFTGHYWRIRRRFVGCVPPKRPRPKPEISEPLNAGQ